MKPENVAIVMLGVGAYFLFKEAIKPEPDPTTRDYNKEDRQQKKDGVNLTYSELQYQNFASVIYDKISAHIGRDDKSGAADILMRMQNLRDIIALEKAFNKAHLYSGDPIPWANPNKTKTMMQALSDEFYWPLFDGLKSKVNADWKSKGINYEIP